MKWKRMMLFYRVCWNDENGCYTIWRETLNYTVGSKWPYRLEKDGKYVANYSTLRGAKLDAEGKIESL